MSCYSRRTGSCATARIGTRESSSGRQCNHEGTKRSKVTKDNFRRLLRGLRVLLRRRVVRVRGVPVAIRGAAEDPPAVVSRDGRLTDVGRLRVLRFQTGYAHVLADLQRVLAPALTKERVRRTAFDLVDDRLAALFRLDVRVDVWIGPVHFLDHAAELDRLVQVEFR